MVEVLRSGKKSIEELIAAVDPTNEARVQRAVEGLVRDGMVRVTRSGVSLA